MLMMRLFMAFETYSFEPFDMKKKKPKKSFDMKIRLKFSIKIIHLNSKL